MNVSVASKWALALACAIGGIALAPAQDTANLPFMNPKLSAEQRSTDIVSRMTLEEKVLQMQNSAPAIPRLGIPAYNWWNEALHGVATGRATVFPEPIGMGASFDPEMVHRVADAISTEARAKYNEAQRHPPVDGSGSGRSARPHRRIELLVAEPEHLPRSPLGPRPGNVRRRPLPDQPHGRRVRDRNAGQRSALSEGRRHPQALRGPQRS